jgi:hypothetical protein
MSESSVHGLLVASLIEMISRDHGVVTHAAGSGLIPDPPRIGDHEPDVLARGAITNTLVIGEAKRGEDLFEERALQQFLDFSTYVDEPTGPAALIIAVPKGWRDQAERAVQESGGSLERTSVLEVSFPPAADV